MPSGRTAELWGVGAGGAGTRGAGGCPGPSSPLPGWVGASCHTAWTGGPSLGGPGPHGSRVCFGGRSKFAAFSLGFLSSLHVSLTLVSSLCLKRNRGSTQRSPGARQPAVGAESRECVLGENSPPLAPPLPGPVLIPAPQGLLHGTGSTARLPSPSACRPRLRHPPSAQTRGSRGGGRPHAHLTGPPERSARTFSPSAQAAAQRVPCPRGRGRAEAAPTLPTANQQTHRSVAKNTLSDISF